MMYTKEPKFVPVVVRHATVWIDEESFNTMAGFRKERIRTGTLYNNGPSINDQDVDAGEVLVAGGGVTVWELSVFADAIQLMQKLFGKEWFIPTKHDEVRTNPAWMEDYYKDA